MKNIKLITYGNFPYGGASANYLRYLSRALLNEGNEIEVILPKGNLYGNNVEPSKNKQGEINGIKYRHLAYINQPHSFLGKIISKTFSIIFPLFYLIKEHFVNPYKTILLYNTNFSSLVGLLIVKILFRKEVIIIIPEFYEKPSKRNLFAFLNWYDFFLGFKLVARYANAYIVFSNYLKSYILNNLKVEKPIMVLPNLMDPEFFNIAGVAPFKTDSVTIGYAGTPTRKDGAEHLIISFAQLRKKFPTTHLLLIGDVINGQSIIPKLKELASSLNIIDYVSFTGLIPFEQIPKLLNSCQILALTRPSGVFAEAGFPTKLGEYFACRKPVLITKVGDIDAFFKNEVHLIIAEPDKIESIVAGFTKLLTEPHLIDYLSKNAYQWMNDNLNYRNVSVKINIFIMNISN